MGEKEGGSNTGAFVERVKEVVKAYGMMFRLAFDPREDPLVIEFFKQRKKQEKAWLKGVKHG